ncbi:hypothetical protein M404DRAFT_778550 [Pisolithus tinctorius Marx 270]|uniref:Uncharacterized protein n=1 Tax=Pisolithus tinctorius Marx 270 TaxID=870435 RepID=A0A0C3NWQ6_PISTI|nr:hypothetical protein M404DRAFT_778550 [Pisolithus tinctorius Marx 270]
MQVRVCCIFLCARPPTSYFLCLTPRMKQMKGTACPFTPPSTLSNGITSVIDPEPSWVARWQRVGESCLPFGLLPGAVDGFVFSSSASEAGCVLSEPKVVSRRM